MLCTVMDNDDEGNITIDGGLFYKAPYLVYLSPIDTEFHGSRYDIGYAVINTDTGVTEFCSPSLPDCIGHATHSAAALVFLLGHRPDQTTSEDVETSIFDDLE